MSLLLLTVSELLNEGMLCTYTHSLSTGGVGNWFKSETLYSGVTVAIQVAGMTMERL